MRGTGLPFFLLPLLASWAYGVWLYSTLPDRIPVHWDGAGQIDRYGAPWEAAFLLPLIGLLEAGLFLVLWLRNRALGPLFGTILGFMLVIHLVVGTAARTGELPSLIFGNQLLAGLLPLALGWAYGAWLYTRLPERVPLHWGLDGQVDGWGSRLAGAFLLPGVMTGITALMLAISREAPIVLVTGFMLVLQVVLSLLQLKHLPATD